MKKNSYMSERHILKEGLIDKVFDMILGRMDRRRKQQVMKDPKVKRAFADYWKHHQETQKVIDQALADLGLERDR